MKSLLFMTKLSFSLVFLFITFSCSLSNKLSKNYKQTILADGRFLITGISNDSSYGYSPKNAVEVGGSSPSNERRYLNSLMGPNGETLNFFRAGSCCGQKSKNGLMGYAMLDKYMVYWKGCEDTLAIYINMYDSTELMAPIGLKVK